MTSIFEKARTSSLSQQNDLSEMSLPDFEEELPSVSEEGQFLGASLLNPEPSKGNIFNRVRNEIPPPSEEKEKSMGWFMQNIAPPAINLLEHVVEWPGRMRNFFNNTILGIYENASTNFEFPEKLGMQSLLGIAPGFFQEKQREAPEGLKKTLGIGRQSPFLEPGQTRKEVTGPAFEAIGGEKEDLTLEPGSTSNYLTEVGKNLIDLYSPGSGFQKHTTKIGSAILGETVKEVAREMNATDQNQEIAKMVSMLSLSLMNETNGWQYVTKGLNDAEKMIPAGATMDVAPITRAFNDIKRQSWFKGFHDDTKGPAIKIMNDIEGKIANAPNAGRLDAETVLQLRKDIVQAQKKVGKFDFPGDKKAASVYLDQVDKALEEGINNYGRTVNPQFLKQYNEFRQAYAVTKRSGTISNFMQKKFGKPLTSDLAKVAFGNILASGGLALPKIAAIGFTVAGLGQGIRILHRISNSPVLSKYYFEAIKQASLGNAQAMQNSMIKFDEEARNQEKKRPPLNY